MILAAWLHDYPDFLRADFQQFYGLNIDEIGVSFSVHHAATLASMLPTESRTIAVAAPYASWSLQDQLLAAATNALNLLVWMEADPKRNRSNKPKPIEPPKKHSSDSVYLDADEYLSTLKEMRG